MCEDSYIVYTVESHQRHFCRKSVRELGWGLGRSIRLKPQELFLGLWSVSPEKTLVLHLIRAFCFTYKNCRTISNATRGPVFGDRP